MPSFTFGKHQAKKDQSKVSQRPVKKWHERRDFGNILLVLTGPELAAVSGHCVSAEPSASLLQSTDYRRSLQAGGSGEKKGIQFEDFISNPNPHIT